MYQFKRDEQSLTATALNEVTENNSESFKYKSSLLGTLTSELTAADGADLAYRTYKNAQILVPLKYPFFRSLESPLINTKVHLELSWTKNCIMSTVENNSDDVGNTNTSQITKTVLYVPAVT